MYIDKRSKEELHYEDEIMIGFHILNYNQSLIQFADSKANALLLINSIFIASISPYMDAIKKAGSSLGGFLLLVFLASSICSILLALGVITTRKGLQTGDSVRGQIFYGHIVQNRSPEGYISEMASADAKTFHESILRNIYAVSEIASKKFAIYNFGQNLTIVSCVFWIMNMVLLLIM